MGHRSHGADPEIAPAKNGIQVQLAAGNIITESKRRQQIIQIIQRHIHSAVYGGSKPGQLRSSYNHISIQEK
ncbi:hypothetical protein D3C79_978870 [compost metagenome]